MGSTRLEILKDPKGVYPKMPVQLFQEQEDQPEAATFSKL
jgi:hypothetical protein